MNQGDARPRLNSQPAPARPTANHAAQQTQQRQSSANFNAPQQPKKSGGFKKALVTVGVVLLVAAIAAGGWFVFKSVANPIDTGKYQAVFFTNGQVYFGKLQKFNGEYYKLTSVFYLQTQNNDDESSNLQSSNNQNASDLQLVKLGNEIHGPEDAMIISKDQVLFFENLKADGKVSQSINQYKSEQ
jgi:uncharacterized protein YpmB